MKRMLDTMLCITSFTILIASAVVCLLMCSGCSRAFYQARDIRKLDALSIQQPTEFLRLSTLINPCFDGKAKSDTVIVKGAPVVTVLKGDTVTAVRRDTVIRTITLAGRQIVLPEFVTIHDTVSDGRKVASLQAQLTGVMKAADQSMQALEDEKKKAKTRLAILIALSVVIVGFIAIKVYSFFCGGGIATAGEDIIKKL